MNVSEYIASGILEVYVLGELPSAEATDVEEMAALHPEVRQEITSIQHTYEALADRWPITPRPALKDKILNQLTGSPDEASPSAVLTEPGPPASETSPVTRTVPPPSETVEHQPTVNTTSTVAAKQRSLLPFQLGIAASLLVAVASAVAAFHFRNQWKETQLELSQVIAQNQEVASRYETASQRVDRLESDLSIIESGDFQRIALAGTDLSPASSASVYWNQNSSQVYLNAGNLPAPPSDRQYQLWAIVDGKPVSAGVLALADSHDEPTSSTLQSMSSDITKAAAFAITLEPRGGSESPTLEAMYVQGAVAGS